MKFMKTIMMFASTISILMLTSCLIQKAPNGYGNAFKPRPLNMKMISNYSAESDWQKGFNDGCQSATGIMAGGLPRILPDAVNGWRLTGKNPLNPAEKNPEIADKGLYGTGFNDGFEQCTYHYDWWVF
jgi:hypothetical protein